MLILGIVYLIVGFYFGKKEEATANYFRIIGHVWAVGAIVVASIN